ncbi:hypothetical protein P7C70_g8022, partial [Phenoliferia sp. Uapishka_3]
MSHLPSPLGFRHVVRAAASASNGTAKAAVAATGGTASPPPGASAAQATAMFNGLYAQDLALALLLGFGVFFLFSAPIMSSWFATGRFTQGWTLGEHKTATPEYELRVDAADHKLVSMNGLVIYQPIKAVSNWFANWRWFYNKVLLPSVPVFDLTVGQVLICLAYETLVLVFLLVKAGNLEVNYKRPGYIAVAQIPAVWLLGKETQFLAPSGEIARWLLRITFETNLCLHTIQAGRMMILCGLLHTYFFLKKDYDAGVPVDFSKPVMYTGLVASCALTFILFSSISYFRRAFYQTFLGELTLARRLRPRVALDLFILPQYLLVSHIVGWLIFIIAVNLHVPEVARPYTYVGIGGYILDVVVRIAKTRLKSANVVTLAGGVTMLQVSGLSNGWRAGQHVWVRVLNGRRFYETHPFTIANAPADISPLPGKHNLTILAKSAGDWTQALLETASVPSPEAAKSGGYGRTVSVSIEGSMYTDFSESQNIILFAGGSGITFAASVLEEIIGQAIEGTCRARTLTLVWTIKTITSVDWYQEMFNSLLVLARTRSSLEVKICLYITGREPAQYCPIRDASVTLARPNIAAIIEDAVDDVTSELGKEGYTGRGGGIAVGTCGPDPLVRGVRIAVGGITRARAVKAGGIVSHSECFGW